MIRLVGSPFDRYATFHTLTNVGRKSFLVSKNNAPSHSNYIEGLLYQQTCFPVLKVILYLTENLSQDEIGEPILDKVLEPGDCLYFPRGYIHQAVTLEDIHSLHITLSVYQRNSWGDFLEKVVLFIISLCNISSITYIKDPFTNHYHFYL